MEKIILQNIEVNKNQVIYYYEVTKQLEKYFTSVRNYKLKYEMNVEHVPKSILAIPFICNILPLSWILNAQIITPELDKNFYECIPFIKKSYQKMYPKLNFSGEIQCKNIVNNIYKPEGVAMMFSGGVDATATLVKHISEKPLLINLQGSDINLKYTEVLENVKKRIENMAEKFSLKVTFVKTEFRNILNEKVLDEFIQVVNDNYWHALQHGIAILSHAAPIAYMKRLEMVYIASSYTKDDHAKCASDPTIDNLLKMACTSIYHDNFDLTRGQKIDLINEYCKNKNLSLDIRVCFNERKTENCCKCEKCYRTIYEIISRDGDPKNFGFNLPKNFVKKSKFHFRFKIIFNPAVIVLWKKIQVQFNKNPKLKAKPEYSWFLNFDFEKSNNFIKEWYAKVTVFLKKLLKK